LNVGYHNLPHDGIDARQ